MVKGQLVLVEQETGDMVTCVLEPITLPKAALDALLAATHGTPTLLDKVVQLSRTDDQYNALRGALITKP